MVSEERSEIITLIVIINLAYREGDLNRLLVPRDTEGLQCGQDSEVVDKPFLVFFDLAKCADPLVPLNGCPTPQTCVSKCPSSNFVHSKATCEQNFAAYKERLICTRQTNMASIRNCNDVDEKIKAEQCSQWYLKSEPCKYIKFQRHPTLRIERYFQQLVNFRILKLT